MNKKFVTLFCCVSLTCLTFYLGFKAETSNPPSTPLRKVCRWNTVSSKVFFTKNKWPEHFRLDVKPSRQFYPLGINVFVYSAYLDTRDPKVPYVRLLALAERINDTIVCTVTPIDAQDRTSIAFFSFVELYRHPEHHHSFYSVYILSCPLPSVSDRKCYGKLGSVTLLRGSYSLSIKVIQDTGTRYPNLTRCLPVLYGDAYDPEWVDNFLTSNIRQGFSYFQMYVLPNVSVDILEVLKSYSGRGYLNFYTWNLPISYLQIWYYGQILAVLDCQYSLINNDGLTLFADVDEMLVSYGTSDKRRNLFPLLFDLVNDSDNNKLLTGYRIPTYTIYTNRTRLDRVLNAVSLPERLDYKMAKCLVKPKLIFAMGVHTVVEPLNTLGTFTLVNSSKFYIVHIRRCSTVCDSVFYKTFWP